MGYEPTHPAITPRVKLLYLMRMIPLVENNYHMIELGPRQTGKSFCFTEFSPYGTLLAGGAVTVPKLFVTTASPPQPGLIRSQDTIGFDEIAGSTFNRDDDKNLYKNYMESGQINRGTITVTGEAGFVFNGNINFDPRRHAGRPSLQAAAAEHQRRHGFSRPLGCLSAGLGDSQAQAGDADHARRLHPRLHQRAVPPRPAPVGRLRHTLGALVRPQEGQWSARDKRSIDRTFSGLTKLIFPDGVMTKEDARLLLEWALELRLRVRLQLHAIDAT